MLMPSIFGENLFDDFFDGFARPVRRSEGGAPVRNDLMKTDIRETETGFDLTIDLPGYNKEDVKAELKDGYLTISATRTSNKEEKDEKGHYIRRERYSGSCSRCFYVGEDVTEQDIKARFENGTLQLNVPKIEKKPEEPKTKLISID
ncbi:MAG: Hsp20/alpha crystallin family protein [Lachnospiraceae bacterium]|nr:Hsp20/alpha crystallin family protein [Lachnospiraceae bacterium]